MTDFCTRCRLALIAHQYHLHEIAAWALDTIIAWWETLEECPDTYDTFLTWSREVADNVDNPKIKEIVRKAPVFTM